MTHLDMRLHTAAARYKAATVKKYLSQGFDVNARTENGWTPLHQAAWKNRDPKVVPLLIAAGAAIHAKTLDVWSPIHLAAHKGSVPDIRALLNAGADVNARSRDGFTPLHTAAARAKDREVFKVLLEAGADPGAKDKKGKIPLDIAIEYKNETARLSLWRPICTHCT